MLFLFLTDYNSTFLNESSLCPLLLFFSPVLETSKLTYSQTNFSRSPRAVGLNQGPFYSPGNTWQCLETFLSQLGRRAVLWALVEGGWWREARDGAQHRAVPGTAPTTQNYQAGSVSRPALGPHLPLRLNRGAPGS